MIIVNKIGTMVEFCCFLKPLRNDNVGRCWMSVSGHISNQPMYCIVILG